ncbi:MAG: RNA polymerase sigma factor [Tepidisphaerales bacterium]
MPLTDPRTDQQLVAAFNDGDATAFDGLYYRYRDWVVRLAWRFAGDADDALDVLQETFAYVTGKFPGFHLSSSFTTFLYPVVKNTALAIRRKRRRTLVGDAAMDTLAAGASIDPLAADDLKTALDALPEAHREVLLMRYVDDLSLEETGEALGIPLGTVKSRIHNALKQLRDDPRARGYFLEDP